MEHKDLYKNVPSDVSCIREKKRREQLGLWHDRRTSVLARKRPQLKELSEDIEFTIEDVELATLSLVKKKGDSKHCLAQLNQAFVQNSKTRDVFLKIDSALAAVISMLTGRDSDLQLEAARTLTNLAAGSDNHTMVVAKHAAPYLITFLSSSNTSLQSQSAWGIGNIAGGCKKCASLLHVQGVIPALTKLLESSSPGVLQPVIFAACNFVRHDQIFMREFQEQHIYKTIDKHLLSWRQHHDVLTEAVWLLWYLLASDYASDTVILSSLLRHLLQILQELVTELNENSQVVTSIIRCLGNLSCTLGSDIMAEVFNPSHIVSLSHIMCSQQHHMRKECLWLLSNLTVCEQFCDMAVEGGLLPLILQMFSSTSDIKIEVLHCINNMTDHGEDLCEALLAAEVLPVICSTLDGSHDQIVLLSLAFCNAILSNTSSGAERMKDCGGLNHLKALSQSSTPDIKEPAAAMYTHYTNKLKLTSVT